MSGNGVGEAVGAEPWVPSPDEVVRACAVLLRAIRPGDTVAFRLPIRPALVAPGEPPPVAILVVARPVTLIDWATPVHRDVLAGKGRGEGPRVVAP